MAGIVISITYGAAWPVLWPGAALLGVSTIGLLVWSGRQRTPAATDIAGLLSLLTVMVLGAALTQEANARRRADHLARIAGSVECYRAVVDDYTAARPTTWATTLRVRAVRVAGRWQVATGNVRVTLPRTAGVAPPRYGEVWLIDGHPNPTQPPPNPGEFDYRRYLEYRQVYHQQYLRPDQYRVLGLAPASVLVAVSMRAASQLEAVFRQYVGAPREAAIASALVLGLKDDVDAATKLAYASTGTTHIMAVSGLQVGLLFAALTWALQGLFGRVRGFRIWSALLGLAVIWSYAFLTGLSASVLRATVMFTFVIVGRALGRQEMIFNTLAVAAFVLLVWNPFLVVDVGFQLSFLAVLSIVYLQPRIAGWLAVEPYFYARQRAWHSPARRRSWQGSGWALDKIWQATALSLAAQVATFGLGLFYFHQFPLSFLVSNLVAVPISSAAVYVGLGLLSLKGVAAALGTLLPASAAGVLDWLPRCAAGLFERMVWIFNEYIFWVSRAMSNWVIREIQLSALQTVLLFAMVGAGLVWLNTRRLAWLGGVAAVLMLYAGSRVADARAVAATEEFIVYSLPHRSVVGFWRGATAEFITPDSLPLSDPERTYHLLPALIQRGVRRPIWRVGWRGTAIPVRRLADPDSASNALFRRPGPLVLAQWRGLRIAFVSSPISSAARPAPVDVLVLRRRARLRPETVAAVFGPRVQIVFDSSCKTWAVARQDSSLRARGFRTWDVAVRGAFRCRPPQR